MKLTLVLNVNYLPIGVVDARRAFKNVFAKTLEPVSNYEGVFFKSPNREYEVPSVTRTKTFVNIPYVNVNLSRENVFKRDRYTCVYCGENRRKLLTVDHIIPKSKGGTNSWKNLVCCCHSCNNEKGDLSLEELGWKIPIAFKPHFLTLIAGMPNSVPEDWKHYLMVR